MMRTVFVSLATVEATPMIAFATAGSPAARAPALAANALVS
ncbi:MAG TPA: hypothetical protein VGK48_03635 [Terriglobia bacterium]|jgi:hypothetical protein